MTLGILKAMERLGMPAHSNRLVGYLVTFTVVGSVAVIAARLTLGALEVNPDFLIAIIEKIPLAWFLVGLIAFAYYVGAALHATMFANTKGPTASS